MRNLAACSVLLTSLILPLSMASAQEPPPLGQFSILTYHPAPGANNYYRVDGATVRGVLEPAVGLQLDYAHRPFVLYDATCQAGDSDCSTTGEAINIADYVATAHVWASLALFNRFQLGLIVPFAITEGQPFRDPNGPGNLLDGGFAFAVADPRLHLKANILDDPSGFRLGVAAWVSAPLGQMFSNPRTVGRFLGDEQPSFGGHVIAEYAVSGFRATANLGGTWRDGDRLFSTTAGSQFNYGVGLGYDITPLVGVLGEVVGATAFSSQVDENPLEGRLGVRLKVGDIQLDLAGGGGIVAGTGVPMFRVLAGVAWIPQRSDSDGDGIQDSSDSCPTEREDVDSWHDDDGCPELDNDDDGIEDSRDSCINDAEDMDGEEDTDGCPDRDDDGDGIRDGYDSCPHEPEDMDGDRDDDGCPDNDRDRDNIDDARDSCPDQPEDTDGYGDEDGCPEVDFDNDNVPDDSDQCPDQPEDADNFEDEDGCAEEGSPAPAPSGRRRGR